MAGEVLEHRQIGNLAADPEIREGGGKDPVASFRLLTTRRWKDRQSGEIKERTDGFRFEIWGAAAKNLAEFCKKGDELYIEAIPMVDAIDDGQGGTRYIEKKRVTKWRRLRQAGGSKGQQNGGTPQDDGFDGDDGRDSDIPF
ncbi:MAG: single-stranded DNA-binding protein [Pseudomonadales bacterium]